MKVYITMRNADMCEGRGPMVDDLCFLHREHAASYIDTKEGVQGRKAQWSTEEFGDWTIKAINVIEEDVIENQKRDEALRLRALAKLTPEERKALGL